MNEILLIALVFLLAGYIKGVVGMGLPTVAMGLLGILIEPVQAAALLVIPSLVTNIWQFMSGPSRLVILKRFGLMMFSLCVGTSLGIQFLTATNNHWPNITLGTVLAIYAIVALFHPKFKVSLRYEKLTSPLVGLTTGVLTGATGVFVIPAVPYFSSMGLTKDELIQTLGLSFTISTIALGLALGFSGAYSEANFKLSLFAILPAIAGMFLGQHNRDKIDPIRFKAYFFGCLFCLGSYMALTAAFKYFNALS